MLGIATAARAIATFEMAVPNAAHKAQAIGAMPAAAEQTRRDEVEHVAAPISLVGSTLAAAGAVAEVRAEDGHAWADYVPYRNTAVQYTALYTAVPGTVEIRTGGRGPRVRVVQKKCSHLPSTPLRFGSITESKIRWWG